MKASPIIPLEIGQRFTVINQNPARCSAPAFLRCVITCVTPRLVQGWDPIRDYSWGFPLSQLNELGGLRRVMSIG